MTSMSNLSNLPKDLVEDILSRVPLKSMRAVRLTCKKLNTLSKSKSFTKLHIGRVASTKEGESQMIMMKDFDLYLTRVVFNGINVDPSTEPKGKLTCLNEQVKISTVFHCEGLLLCTLEDDFRIVVMNPYSGETRWIEPSYYHRKERYIYALGYVNKKNESVRSHKILRLLDNYTGSLIRSHNLSYEIYDFDTDLWVGQCFLDSRSWCTASSYDPSVSLNGNTYWCATERNSHNHIICFDFTSERFGPLLRLPFTARHYDVVTLSCVREERLAVLFQLYRSYKIEIWITTKIEAKMVSWSKFLTVNNGPVADIRSTYAYGSFFIDEGKKVAMVFPKYDNRYIVRIIGEAGYLTEVDLGETSYNSHFLRVCSYVPSLVKIKKPTMELKRTYDQHKLSLSHLKR